MKLTLSVLIILSCLSPFVSNAQTGNTNAGTEAGNGGTYNTSLGYYAGNVVTGNNNSFIGSYSGYNLGSGELLSAKYNTSIVLSGNNNSLLGAYSGYNLTTGTGNIFLGYSAGYYETGSNKLYIDNSNTSTPLIYGDFSLNRVGINTVPTETFDINGTFRVRSLSQDNSQTKFLVTDLNGKVFWRDLPGGGDNLGNHIPTQSIVPSVTNVNDLGSATNTFKDAYLSGRIGIGTTPSEQLDVSGTIRLRGVSNSNFSNVLVMDANGKVYKNSNFHWGSTYNDNTVFGNTPFYGTGANNSAFGYITLSGNTTGSYNSSFGSYSMRANTTGQSNTAVGYASLNNNEMGSENTSIGRYSMALSRTASRNTALGVNALTGQGNYFSFVENVAIGYNSLTNNIQGSTNTAVGSYSMNSNYYGSYNTAVGHGTLQNNNDGNSNVAVGHGVLYSNTQGHFNSSFGSGAMYYNTTGLNNTSLGANSLLYNTSGNNNTAVGYSAGVPSGSTISNSTAIGANARVLVNDGIVLGTSSNFVGIRQNSPAYALHVQNAYCDGNTWYNASDKNLKENFVKIKDEESVLSKVLELPIQYWNYKEGNTSRHIGPTAQDFNKIFQIGGNDKAIASVDEAGVALAAIQELGKKTLELEKVVKDQGQLIAGLLNNRVTEEKSQSGAKLNQNHPNPFKVDTQIQMYIPDESMVATFYVYDLKGMQIKQQQLSDKGEVTFKIEAGSLQPGIYLYSLVVNGELVGVRRMVITE